MLKELFLTCAMALPSPEFTKPDYRLSESEQREVVAWIRKHEPDLTVFVHPNPQGDVLRKYGWQKVPLKYKENEIWIQRRSA